MSILEQARKDFQSILESTDWSSDVTIDSGVLSATVKAWASKHHFSINLDTGLPINGKNVHISVSEQTLLDAGFVIRNATTKEVEIRNWKLTYTDSSGNAFDYLINDAMADETLGVLVCYLGDYV
jgi:hypothetical protein